MPPRSHEPSSSNSHGLVEPGGRSRPAERSGRLLLLACGATFLAILDVTVVNLAIPALLSEYRSATIPDLTWVITLYAIVFAALLAPMGRLSDVVGRRVLFRAGVGAFAAMSLACALAPSVPLLLAARALQAAAAAAMIPASLAVVLSDTPSTRRVAAIGIWSAAGALAAAVGPSVGGVLVDVFGWRSLFLINVPFGVVLVALATAVPAPARKGGRLPDLLGTLLLATGVGAVALGVSQGAAWGWGDPRTLACLLAGVAAVALTVLRSTRHPVPALQTSLWRNRTYARANLASLLYGAAMYGAFLVAVLVLTELWRYSELEAGLAMTPGAIAACAAALLASRLRGRSGPRTGVALGAGLMAATALVSAVALPSSPHFLSFWLPVTLVLGAGMGAATTGVTSAASLSVAADRFAAASGLNQTARQIGGALGIATVATLLEGVSIPSAAALGHAYLFLAIAAVLSGIVGLGLALTPIDAADTLTGDDTHPHSRDELAALLVDLPRSPRIPTP